MCDYLERETFVKMSRNSGFNNIVNSVIDREKGFKRSDGFRNKIISSKMQDLRCRENKLVQYASAKDASDCRLLKTSSENSAVCVRRERQKTRHPWDYIFKITFSSELVSRNHPFVPCFKLDGPFHEKMEISDCIEINNLGLQYLLYCGNCKFGGKVILNVLDHNEASVPDEEWRFKSKLFCLAENKFTGVFAVGAQNGFYLFNRRDLYPLCSFEDSVTSLTFNEDGKVLFIGRENHGVAAIDFRCTKERHNHLEISKNLGHRNAKAIRLLSDHVSLIVSSEKVSKVDLRMGSILFDYPDHFDTSESRRSISLNEDVDVICATGKDNHTRIWSLSTGKLMKTFAPYLKSGSPAYSCFHSLPAGFSVIIMEEGFLCNNYLSYSYEETVD